MDARTSRYHDVYTHWQRSPEVFWAEAAAAIDWYEKPKKIFDKDAGVYGRWFTDGVVNTCYNAVDRHPDTRFIIDHLGIMQPRVPPAPPQPCRSPEGAGTR